ncbi:hypothetical protein CK507_08395 [Pseudomonas sp. WN033]|nr:hypothetical protein CK507_08395 [Pseudomonas sp. WN033]
MSRTRQPRTRPSSMQGFTLLEVLIAVLVIGFGIIAMGKFFSLTWQNSGFVRQQSIALSLAQSKIEDLRLYVALTCPTGQTCLKVYDDIATGNETEGDFTVSWTVAPFTLLGGATGNYKEVAVNVSWTDLMGENRQLQTTALIAANDPRAVASLMQNYVPPGNMVQPFNRVLRVPIPAEYIDQNTSRFTPPGSDKNLIISNTTGNVIGGLDSIPLQIPDNTAFFLLSGYISFGSGNLRPTSNANSNINMLLFNTTNQPMPDSECWDDSHLSSQDKAYSDFITFTCVVKSNTTLLIDNQVTPAWSGYARLSLNGLTNSPFGWGTSSSSDKVCRFEQTPATYVNVTETLANQNFIIIQGNRNCPSASVQFQP